MRSIALTASVEDAFACPPNQPRRVPIALLRARHTLLAVLLTAFGAVGVVAMPLAEYRERTDKAVQELAAADEAELQATIREYERTTVIIDGILRTFPFAEAVEWNGRQISVNDEWLAENLKAFQALPFGDRKRSEILQRAIDRLRALDERLEEIDPRTAPTAAATKTEDKSRLEEISGREVFKPKPPQENLFQRAWRRFLEWVKGLFPSGSGLEAGSMSWLSFIAMVVIFGLAAGVLGYAVSKLLPYFQRGRGKPARREARIVLGERLAPDQSASDLLAEAEALARDGEVRAAIRKAYIALLCELGDRKILTLAQSKTNRDYLRAVRDKRPLLAEMQRLTSTYEDHWYGARQTSTDDWTAFRAGYEKALSS